jgi:tetratricopeptide (TPR) repeat protein
MPRVLAAAVLLVVPGLSFACLWDYDTLKQERSRFPDTLEIITGKFLRHSPEFYEWRIKDRLAKLKTDPSNPALHDDLAVAYAKTGQYAKAIATMEALEKIAPERYETYSNLGTFHFLAGDIPKALPLIDKALAINPDAHFGREKYQRWLGEYILQPTPRPSFSIFLEGKRNHVLSLEDIQECVKALLGMMRFADHDNPYLLLALADMVTVADHGRYPELDGKRLGARAVLRTGYSADHRSFSPEALKRATDFLDMQLRYHGGDRVTVNDVAARFLEELADAESWYADLRAKEIGWIESGMDPEAEFDKLYVVEPQVEDDPSDVLPLWQRIGVGWTAALLIGAGIGTVAAVVLLARFISRRLSANRR